MSAADIERFVQDLKTDQDLQARIKDAAAGLDSVVEFARGRGYDISVDEAKAYIQAQASQDLTDDQMEALAGGKHHHHRDHNANTKVVVVQSVASVTTEAVSVETTTTTVAESEVAVVVIVI
jgi:predicted ribosomally synthesized peptide with nif11-like leader